MSQRQKESTLQKKQNGARLAAIDPIVDKQTALVGMDRRKTFNLVTDILTKFHIFCKLSIK